MKNVVPVKHRQSFDFFLTKIIQQQLPSERKYIRNTPSQNAFLRQMGLLCQSSIKMAENAFEQGEAKGYQEVFAPAKKWLVRCKPENRSLLIKNLSHFDTRSLLVTCNIMHLEEERTEHDIALIKKGIALKQHLLDWNHWLKLVASLKKESTQSAPLHAIMKESTQPVQRMRCCITLLKQGPGIVTNQAELCVQKKDFTRLALITHSFCDQTMLKFLDIYCTCIPQSDYLLEQLSHCRDQLKVIAKPVAKACATALNQPIYALWSSPYLLQDEDPCAIESTDQNEGIIDDILDYMAKFKTRSLLPTPSKLQASQTSKGKFSRFNAFQKT